MKTNGKAQIDFQVAIGNPHTPLQDQERLRREAAERSAREASEDLAVAVASDSPAKMPRKPYKPRKLLDVPYTLAWLEAFVRLGVTARCARPDCRQELRAPIKELFPRLRGAGDAEKLTWTFVMNKNGALAAYCSLHTPTDKKLTPIRFVEETF